MKLFFKILLSFITCIYITNTLASDNYDSSNSQLNIPSVLVGNTTYNNVVIKVSSVISVGNSPALNLIDVYNPETNQLYIPSVNAGNTTYYNVVITVGPVISIGGASTLTLAPSAQNQIDGLIQSFMNSNNITAASFTAIKSGNVLYNKSYGFLDQANNIKIVNDPLMVTASIVKPLTAASIQRLASTGALSLQDHVFCTGSNKPCWLNVTSPNGTIINGTTHNGSDFASPGYALITIQNLIDHEGGWDRNLKTCYGASYFVSLGYSTPCDPMAQEALIQQVLNSKFPANYAANQLPNQMNDIYYWATTNPLDYHPGNTQAYSNFGYMLLTAIVSQATGQDYQSYVYKNILAPMGVSQSDFSSFTYTPSNDSPQGTRTPYSIPSLQCPSIYSPGSTVYANKQGCLNPVNWVGAATTLTTSKVMAQFASVYKIDNSSNLNSTITPGLDGPNNGVLLNGSFNSGEHDGGLASGVSNILRQLPSGSSYTLMLNKDNSVNWQETLYPQIDKILSAAGF